MLFDNLMNQYPQPQDQPMPFGNPMFQPQPGMMGSQPIPSPQQPTMQPQTAPQTTMAAQAPMAQPQGSMAPMTSQEGEKQEQALATQNVVPGVAQGVPSDGGVMQKTQQVMYDASQVQASPYDQQGYQFKPRIDMGASEQDALAGIGQSLLAMGLTYLVGGDMDAAVNAGFGHFAKLEDQAFRYKQIDSLKAQGYTDASIEEFIETGSKQALARDKRELVSDQHGNLVSVNPFNPNDRFIVQSSGVEKFDAASNRMVRVYNDGMGRVTVQAQDGTVIDPRAVDLRDPKQWQQEQEMRMKREQLAFSQAMDRDASARGWESLRQQRELKELQLDEYRERRDAAAEAKAAAEMGRAEAEKEKAYQKVAIAQTAAQQPLNEAVDASVQFMMNPDIMNQGGRFETLPGVQGASRYLNPEIYNQMDTMLAKQFVSIAATKPFGGNPSNLESSAMSEANSAGVVKDAKSGNWEMKRGMTPNQITNLAFNSAERSLYNKAKADYMLQNRLTSTNPQDESQIKGIVQSQLQSLISNASGSHRARLKELYNQKYKSSDSRDINDTSNYGAKYGY